jgi:hypothetical protein
MFDEFTPSAVIAIDRAGMTDRGWYAGWGSLWVSFNYLGQL